MCSPKNYELSAAAAYIEFHAKIGTRPSCLYEAPQLLGSTCLFGLELMTDLASLETKQPTNQPTKQASKQASNQTHGTRTAALHVRFVCWFARNCLLTSLDFPDRPIRKVKGSEQTISCKPTKKTHMQCSSTCSICMFCTEQMQRGELSPPAASSISCSCCVCSSSSRSSASAASSFFFLPGFLPRRAPGFVFTCAQQPVALLLSVQLLSHAKYFWNFGVSLF